MEKHKRGRLMTGEPNPVDMHVGVRLRLRRAQLGVSQEALAKSIGVTFQQVQKYERGKNRIGASRLFDIARALDVSAAYFFDDMPKSIAAASPVNVTESSLSPDMIDAGTQGVLALLRAYGTLSSDLQAQVRQVVRALSRSAHEAEAA